MLVIFLPSLLLPVLLLDVSEDSADNCPNHGSGSSTVTSHLTTDSSDGSTTERTRNQAAILLSLSSRLSIRLVGIVAPLALVRSRTSVAVLGLSG